MRKGAIIFLLLPLILAGTVALSIFSKPVHNVKELAKWADCEPENVRDWLDHNYVYDKQFNENFGIDTPEPTGDVCIARKTGNCRCYAAISQDTLNECPGYHAHMACMRSGPTEAHCVTFFIDPKGRRGFINSGAQAMTFPADKPWSEIVQDVGGGPWVTP